MLLGYVSVILNEYPNCHFESRSLGIRPTHFSLCYVGANPAFAGCSPEIPVFA